MARNEERRSHLADAGLSVLATEGARGLTHRAVDVAARVPTGTTSNYFRSRAALLEGLVARIGERLAPDPDVLADLAGRPPSRALFRAYVGYVVQRLLDQREVALALMELRLEAARRPEVAGPVSTWLRAGLAADVAFHEGAGLPGGALEVGLFHYAVDGLLLDRLTVPIDPATGTDEVLDVLVERLMPAALPPGE